MEIQHVDVQRHALRARERPRMQRRRRLVEPRRGGLQLQAAAARLNEPTAALHAWSLARAQRVPLHIDMLNLHMGCLIRVVRLPFTLAPECRGCGAPSVHASVLART